MVDTWVVSRVKSVQVVNINRKHFMMGLGQWDFTPNKVKVTNLISLLSIIVHIHIPMSRVSKVVADHRSEFSGE